MCKNEFEYFLLEMHDKIIHNSKICLEVRGHSVSPFDTVTIYRPLGWSNWPLEIDTALFKNHWFRTITKHTLGCAWAQLGGGHEGRVSPTFSESGDIFCHVAHIFFFRFCNILVSHQVVHVTFTTKLR